MMGLVLLALLAVGAHGQNLFNSFGQNRPQAQQPNAFNPVGIGQQLAAENFNQLQNMIAGRQAPVDANGAPIMPPVIQSLTRQLGLPITTGQQYDNDFGKQAQPTAVEYCPPFIALEEACRCYSHIDGAVIECDGPGGPAVVEKLKGIQTEISKLIMRNAKIIKVGPHAFRNLRIKRLDMSYNKIKSINADALRGLENVLEELTLEHNQLTEVPTDALEGMTTLSVLNLKCNNIGDMFAPVFPKRNQLIEVNLACNQICKIAPAAFGTARNSLQSLILDNNCLSELDGGVLSNFTRLLALHARYNQIEDLSKIVLKDLPNMFMLKLTGNKVQMIENFKVTAVPNVRYLFLDKNQIRSMAPDSLSQFKNLEILDLSYNNIAEIPTHSFKGLEKLMQLNLEGNAIQDIAPGAFQNTPLLLLLLGSNCLSSVNPQMFQGVPYLRQLSLGNNNIRLVQPLSFNHLVNLHLLDLSNNKIQIVQPGALQASAHVTVLLQENPLVCMQDGYHIIQGGRPIHLINEPNAVCLTDYENDVTDSCPTRKRIPAEPACCSAPQKQTADRMSLFTQNGVQTARPLPSPTQNQPVRATQRPVASSGVETTTVPFRRPVDLSRFWRLTAPPTTKFGVTQQTVTQTTPLPVDRPINTVPAVTAGSVVGERRDPLSGQAPFVPNSGLVVDNGNFGSQLPPWASAGSPAGNEFGNLNNNVLMLNKDSDTFSISRIEPEAPARTTGDKGQPEMTQ